MIKSLILSNVLSEWDKFKMSEELSLSILNGHQFMEKGYRTSELNLDFNF